MIGPKSLPVPAPKGGPEARVVAMNTAAWSAHRTTCAAIALALVGAGSVTAHAAAVGPRLCPVLTDAAGDATLYVGGVTPDGAGKGTVPSDASLDVVSADLALSGPNLVATVRTSKLTRSNPNSPLGQYFAVTFRIDGALLVLDGVLSPLSDHASITRADGSNVGGAPTYPASIRPEVPRSAVVLTVALADVNRLAAARRGTKLTAITALTQRVVGVSPGGGSNASLLVGADNATTKRTYVVGTPTRC